MSVSQLQSLMHGVEHYSLYSVIISNTLSHQSLSVWITTPIMNVCSFTQPNLYLYGLRLQSRMLFHSAQSLSVWITTPIMYALSLSPISICMDYDSNALSLSPISICMDYDSNHVCSFTQPNLYLYGLRLQSRMLFH